MPNPSVKPTREQIQQALHARRVVPLAVENPHGPLGLEHLAAAIAQIDDPPVFSFFVTKGAKPSRAKRGASS